MADDCANCARLAAEMEAEMRVPSGHGPPATPSYDTLMHHTYSVSDPCPRCGELEAALAETRAKAKAELERLDSLLAEARVAIEQARRSEEIAWENCEDARERLQVAVREGKPERSGG